MIPHASSKKTLLFVQFWAACGFCKRVLNGRICQHCDVKTSTVTPTFYYFFIIFLTCYISVASFINNLCYILLLGNHLKNDLRVLHKTRTHSTHALIFGGKIIACPASDWQTTGGEKSFTNTTRFHFLVYFALFFSSLNYNELASSLPLKAKRNTWFIAEEKDFLLLCKEKAIADLLDKCVTSAGVSRPF